MEKPRFASWRCSSKVDERGRAKAEEPFVRNDSGLSEKPSDPSEWSEPRVLCDARCRRGVVVSRASRRKFWRWRYVFCRVRGGWRGDSGGVSEMGDDLGVGFDEMRRGGIPPGGN
jgi:hypothetical protein